MNLLMKKTIPASSIFFLLPLQFTHSQNMENYLQVFPRGKEVFHAVCSLSVLELNKSSMSCVINTLIVFYQTADLKASCNTGLKLFDKLQVEKVTAERRVAGLHRQAKLFDFKFFTRKTFHWVTKPAASQNILHSQSV